MAFQTRCPECNARLKFDEAPDAEEAIECPRCGHVFDAADAKPIKVKKKALAGGGGEDEVPRKKKKKKKAGPQEKVAVGAPKKRRSKKKKANLFVLWVMLGVTLFLAPFVGWFGYKLFLAPSKVAKLMIYVPQDCNWMRGCNIHAMLQPGPMIKAPRDVAMKGPFEECRDEFAKAAGSSEAEKFLDYAICGKCKDGSKSGTIYVFETLKSFDAAAMLKSLGGSEQQVSGQAVQKLGAKPGVLAGAYVYCPEDRIIVVVPNEGDAMKMLKNSLAAKASPKDQSVMAKLGSCGNKASHAHIWNIMRPEGDLKNNLNEDIADPLKQALSALSQKVSTTKVFATWISFGKSIKYGVGVECDSPESAQGLVKAMKEGPLGKGEDSDIPQALKMAFSFARNKEFSDFMSNLEFLTTGSCAYLDSSMSYEKSSQMLSYINRPDMFDGSNETSGRGR